VAGKDSETKERKENWILEHNRLETTGKTQRTGETQNVWVREWKPRRQFLLNLLFPPNIL